MRTALFFLAALFLSVGCARKAPPPLVVAPQTQSGPAVTMPLGNGPGGGVAAEPVYQGRTVQQWGTQLENRDPVKRSQASFALSRLGKPGAVALLRGMRNSSETVRLVSLQAATKDQMLQRRDESMSLLLSMLKDPNPDIRRAAAARLAWYDKDSASALPALARLAKTDDDPAVRGAAESAIASIDEYEKSGGKYTRGVLPSNLPKK